MVATTSPRPPASRDVPLVARRPLQGPYLLLTFRHPEVAGRTRAGQFVMIKANTAADPLLRRPFSIMSVHPAEDTFTLFLKVVGSGTRALADLRSGETAGCLGPLGRPFPMPPEDHEALLVAGGYGIAPFVLFGDELRRAGRRARAFYGGRTSGDLQGHDPFTALGLPLACCTDDGSFGHHGRVTDAVEAYLDTRPGAVTLYACGPDAMLHAAARLAERRNVPAQVSLDPWMGCGVGTCLGCVVRIQRADEPRGKYRCACTEGPVFDARDVVWAGEGSSRARREAAAVLR
ncbi:MAG: dihydroorotate dehydrogenase electron transfer subunit [Acidobacteria bacterium]|nr:MAG: dihydroorotate dehydrogenase electron transfer subunit [Acidobacteriota bacterium]